MGSSKLYDRSRVVSDWRCELKAFYNYDIFGTGIATGNSAYELYFGTLIHDMAATTAMFYQRGETVPIDDIALAGQSQLYNALLEQTGDEDYASEQGALVEGLIRGYHKHVWPDLIATYPEVVAVEQEVEYEHDGLVFMAKPDLILGTSAGDLVYVELKTTSNKSDKWLSSWEVDPQLHSSMKAINEKLGVEIGAAIVQGLYKGYDSRGKQLSPFTYANMKSGVPPFFEDEFQYEYRSGLKKFPTWKMPGGVKAWVENMPQDLLAEQFPAVPPVFFKPYIAERFFAQSAVRQKEKALAISMLESMPELEREILDHSFVQHFDQCRPSFGSGCPYFKLCHERGDRNNILPTKEETESLGYIQRTPHHIPEMEYFKENNLI